MNPRQSAKQLGRPGAIAVLLTILLLIVARPVDTSHGGSGASNAPVGGQGSGVTGSLTQLKPNTRLLEPDRDVAATGVTAVGVAGGSLYPAVADGGSLAAANDATYVAVAGGVRRGSHRVGLARAPSGNVTHLVVHARVAATSAPVTVSIHAYERDRLVTSGPLHRLDAGQGWVDITDDLGEIMIASAAALQVEVAFDSGVDGVGSGRYSALVAAVDLSVSLAFDRTGSQGGGLMTAVALPPRSSGTVLVGSDSGGLYRSADQGGSFSARNGSLKERSWLRIAGLAYHPTRDGVVYAVAGAGGEQSSMHRSTDDGQTWSLVTGLTEFSALASSGALEGQPRAVGNLLAFSDDPATGSRAIWAATYQRGVMRSTDDGKTWKVIGLGGLLLRGLAQHPASADMLYVGSYGAGTFVTTDARANVPAFSHVPGGPAHSEELTFVGDTLFVAGGTEGIYRLDGSTLVAVNSGVPLGSANWNSIVGYQADGVSVVYAACDPCQPGPDGTTASIIGSTDGGATWHSLTTPGSVDRHVAGTGRVWSLADQFEGLTPGEPGFATFQLAARAPDDENDDGLILAAAKGGVWRSADAGRTWAPVVNGLGGVDAPGLTGDPANSRRIYQGLEGFGAQSTTDAFDNVLVERPGPPTLEFAVPVAYGAAFDTTTSPSTVYLAVGDAGSPQGEVFTRSGSSAGPWIETGFASDIPRKRPTSVAAGRDSSGTLVLVATAHPAGGIVRKVGDAPWSRIEAGAVYDDPRPVPDADLVWIDGTAVVYLFDPASGIHRSNDAGLTWTLIWENRSNGLGATGLAASANPDVLYVASNKGLHRLDGAASGTVQGGEIALTQLGSFKHTSDVTLDRDARLWVAGPIQSGSPPRLAVSWDPADDEPTFQDLATLDYVNTALRPDSLHVTDDGTVLLGVLGYGTYRGRPSDTRVDPWLPPEIVLHSLDQDEGPDAPVEPLNESVLLQLTAPFVVYVAATGDDERTGLTEEDAVATLARAQDVLQDRFGETAEALTTDVLVRVRSGRYVGQSTRWAFTHPDHVVRIEGYGDGPGASKPSFVGCGERSCASAQPWFRLVTGAGQATNVQLVNLRITKYLRAVVFEGGRDLDTEWNGSNVIHHCAFHNVGTRYRSDVTPEVWSPAIMALRNSRANLIWQNLITDSSNRMDHANEWFHSVYASHGSSDNSIQFNEIVNSSGDFHTRHQSDRNVFANNVIRESFYWALVTDWSSEVESDSCETEISGNIWLGDWYCELNPNEFRRDTASPDGRCAAAGLEDYVVRARNEHQPAGSSCIPH